MSPSIGQLEEELRLTLEEIAQLKSKLAKADQEMLNLHNETPSNRLNNRNNKLKCSPLLLKNYVSRCLPSLVTPICSLERRLGF